MEKKVFTIDGTKKFTFVGYTNGNRWNGWFTPYFSEETTKRICAEQGKLIAEFGEEAFVKLWINEDGFLCISDEGETYVVSEGIQYIDGVRHYCFDMGWVWEEDNTFERFLEELDSFSVDIFSMSNEDIMCDLGYYIKELKEYGIKVKMSPNGATLLHNVTQAINQFINQ
jgi:hypothetical protein